MIKPLTPECQCTLNKVIKLFVFWLKKTTQLTLSEMLSLEEAVVKKVMKKAKGRWGVKRFYLYNCLVFAHISLFYEHLFPSLLTYFDNSIFASTVLALQQTATILNQLHRNMMIIIIVIFFLFFSYLLNCACYVDINKVNKKSFSQRNRSRQEEKISYEMKIEDGLLCFFLFSFSFLFLHRFFMFADWMTDWLVDWLIVNKRNVLRNEKTQKTKEELQCNAMKWYPKAGKGNDEKWWRAIHVAPRYVVPREHQKCLTKRM